MAWEDFLHRLSQAAPMKIQTVLTDYGSQFTDRFTSETRTPSGLTIISLPFRHSSSGALAGPTSSSSGFMNSRDSTARHVRPG